MNLQECPYCTGKSFVRGAISTGGSVTFVPAPDPDMSMVVVAPMVTALACSTCGAIFLNCDPNELPSES